MSATKEKARANGPIPNAVLADATESKASVLNLQASPRREGGMNLNSLRSQIRGIGEYAADRGSVHDLRMISLAFYNAAESLRFEVERRTAAGEMDGSLSSLSRESKSEDGATGEL